MRHIIVYSVLKFGLRWNTNNNATHNKIIPLPLVLVGHFIKYSTQPICFTCYNPFLP